MFHELKATINFDVNVTRLMCNWH